MHATKNLGIVVLIFAMFVASGIIELTAAPLAKKCCGTEHSCGVCLKGFQAGRWVKVPQENKMYRCGDIDDNSKVCEEPIGFCYKDVTGDQYSDDLCTMKVVGFTEKISISKNQCYVPQSSACPPPTPTSTGLE